MMAYTKDNLQRLFQSKFNLSKWQTMMTEFIRADKVRIQPEALDEDAEERKGYFLGSTTTKDGCGNTRDGICQGGWFQGYLYRFRTDQRAGKTR